MPAKMQPPEIVGFVTATLPDVIALYRFGSYGSVHERADSDLDLAVLGRRLFDPLELWNLGQQIAVKLGRHVDLVDLSASSTVFQARIITDGERLFCADPVYCDSYEVYVVSAYARLNEERQGIVDDVLARGSIHGG